MKPRHGLVVALLLAAAWAPSHRAFALDPDKPLSACTVETWSARDGLPESWIRALTQTADGYLWISTAGGVARYDGGRIVILPTSAPWGRVADPVTAKVDRNGLLWVVPSIGTPVCVRDAVAGDCLPKGVELPAGTRLVDLAFDADGAVWMLARDRLFRLQKGGDHKIVPVVTPAFDRATFLHRDRLGRIWLGSEVGLFVNIGGAFEPFRGSSDAAASAVYSVFEDRGGILWLAARNALLRVEGEHSTAYGHDLGYPRSRPSQVIQDRDGNVWVGSTEGLTLFRDGRFVTFTSRDGLPDDFVTALFEDGEGGLWVGTRTGGLAHFTDRNVSTVEGPPELRDNPAVDTVCEDRAGALWFGWRRGLVRWQDGQERIFTERDGLPSRQVLAVAPGLRDEVWVGTTAGLARLRDDHIEAVGAAAGRIDALHVDDDGTLWMALNGQLARLDGDRLETFGAEPGFGPGAIRGMGRDDRGTLWVAATNGVARLQSGRLVDAGLGSTVRGARSMHRDQTGQLWLTTNAGLVRIARGQQRIFGASEGLPGPLFQVLSDDHGHLWVGTVHGILRISKSDLAEVEQGRRPRIHAVSFEVTDRRRDITVSSSRQPGAWKDRRGRLWFATQHALLTVDPARQRGNDRPPTIRIDEAAVDGRPLGRRESNDLPPGPGNLEVRFAAITMLEPHKSLHRYRLEGFDAGWIEAGARRVAYYTNLSPGHYRFRVQGSNGDGVWNPTGDVLEFRLRPEFYRSGWFRGLSVLTLLATGILLYQARVRSLRRAYLAVFAERNRVARELHDTLLQSTTAVALSLQGLQRKHPTLPAAVTQALETMEVMVRTSLQETRGVLGDLRGGSAAPPDLGLALSRLADGMKEGSALECEVRLEGDQIALSRELSTDLFRIAQEALQNALKHASAKHVQVTLSYQSDVVRLTISDDGRGFEVSRAEASAEGHFGLMGMRERAALHGTFRLVSHPGRGTRIEVTALLPEKGSRRG